MAAKASWSLYEVSPVASGCLIMTASGSVYLVAAYSSKLQSLLDLTTLDISAFGTVVAAGSWLSIVPMSYSDKYGPKSTALIGLAMILIGYLLVGFAANGTISLGIGWVLTCAFLIGHGSSWTNAAALVTNATNTSPKLKGAVIGLLQANFALSSGIYTQFFFFSTEVAAFLFTTGIMMSVSVLVAWPSNHRIIEGSKNRTTDTLLIVPLAILTTSTALFVAISAVFGSEALHLCVLICFGILFLVVLVISARIIFVYGTTVLTFHPSFEKHRKDHNVMEHQGMLGKLQGLMKESVEDNVTDNNASEETGLLDSQAKVSASINNDKQYSLKEALKTSQFWLLFICFAVGVGSGLTVLDNITKIIDSHSASGSDDNVHATLKTNAVALFSAFNTGGRISFGFASDWLAAKFGISRTWLLSFNCLLMSVATLFMAFVTNATVDYAVMITAVSYGGFWLLFPALVADFYGSTSYGAIYGMLSIAPTIGAELLYNLMSSMLYDKYNGNEDSSTCFDNDACFKLTFLILSGLCLLSSLMIMYLSRM